MTRRPPKDMAASVRARLLRLARERGEEFQAVLTRYGFERFLYRLAHSPKRNEFVLKGAMLFTLWTGEPHRPTWDLDLLGRGDSAVPRVEEAVSELCAEQVEDDGLVFDPATVRGARIREEQEYEGVRVTLQAHLGTARIPIQLDVAFGDAVTPRPRVVSFPTLLDFPAPKVKAYPRESVISEKYETMVTLGIANTRMKDFYDIWVLATSYAFDGRTLAEAIQATFSRRRTPIRPEEPLALTATFFDDPAKTAQWRAFLNKSRLLPAEASLIDVVAMLRSFLLPPTQAISRNRSFEHIWPAGGPWRSTPQ